jgi:hypothetical protein
MQLAAEPTRMDSTVTQAEKASVASANTPWRTLSMSVTGNNSRVAGRMWRMVMRAGWRPVPRRLRREALGARRHLGAYDACRRRSCQQPECEQQHRLTRADNRDDQETQRQRRERQGRIAHGQQRLRSNAHPTRWSGRPTSRATSLGTRRGPRSPASCMLRTATRSAGLVQRSGILSRPFHGRTACGAPSASAACCSSWASCLDHLVVLNERHLASVLAEFVRYYNRDRPHRTLGWRHPS